MLHLIKNEAEKAKVEHPLKRLIKIEDEDGGILITTTDIHRDNLAGADFDRLDVGSEVQFLSEPAGGGLQAKRVSVGKHHYPG